MIDARDMLLHGQHKAFILEQVPGFDKHETASDPSKPTPLRRFLDMIHTELKVAKKPGYHAVVLRASHQDWVQLMRDREALRGLEDEVDAEPAQPLDDDERHQAAVERAAQARAARAGYTEAAPCQDESDGFALASFGLLKLGTDLQQQLAQAAWKLRGAKTATVARFKRMFSELLLHFRPTGSLTSQAAMMQQDRQALHVVMQQAACYLVVFSAFLIGALLATLSKLCAGVNPKTHRVVMLLVRRAYDETPSDISVAWMTHSELGAFNKKRSKQEGTAKVLQTRCDVLILMNHVSSATYYSMRIPMPCWLMALEKTNAQTTAKAQRSILDMIPGLQSFGQKAKYNLQLVTTDRCASNLKAERLLDTGGINGCTTHHFCVVHMTHTCQSKTVQMLDGQVTGMVATALTCMDAGSIRSLRSSMEKVLKDKVHLCFGSRPEDPFANEYRSAVLETFLPLQDDDGDEHVLGRMQEHYLQRKRSRAIINFFLHGDLQDQDEIWFWSETWGLEQEHVVQLMAKWLIPVLLPKRPPIFSRTRWDGFHDSLLWFGLAQACHGLLRPTLQDFLNVTPTVLPRAAEDDRQEVDADEADMEAVTGNIDWKELKVKMRQKVQVWLQQPLFPPVLLMLQALRPMSRFYHRLIYSGGAEWEDIERTKESQGCRRSYAVLEAARESDLNAYRRSVSDTFHEQIVLLPRWCHFRHYQVLLFRMLSRNVCSTEFLIGTTYRSYPIKLFKSLDKVHEATDPECMHCRLTKLILSEGCDLDSPESQAVLTAIASMFQLHIASIEARSNSADRAQFCRDMPVSGTAQADTVPPEPKQPERKNPWNAFLSEKCRRRISDLGSTSYAALVEEYRLPGYAHHGAIPAAAASSSGSGKEVAVEALVAVPAAGHQELAVPDQAYKLMAADLSDKLQVVQQEYHRRSASVKDWCDIFRDSRVQHRQDQEHLFRECGVVEHVPALNGLVSAEMRVPADKIGEVPGLDGSIMRDLDLLSVGEKSTLRASLLDKWQSMCDLILNTDETPFPDASDALPTRCAQLGMCVCASRGLQAYLFHCRLIFCLKAFFTPKRSRKIRDAAGNMVIKELSQAEQHQQTKLKSNRKLLDDGFVVVCLRPSSRTAAAEEVLPHKYMHSSWKALALTAMNVSAEGEADSPTSLWLHLGHINYTTWALGVLRLDEAGADEARPEYTKLQVPTPQECCHSVRMFEQSGINFSGPWQFTVSMILSNNDELERASMRPDTVLVKQHAEVPNMEFWQGWPAEQARHEKNSKSRPVPSSGKRKKETSSATAGFRKRTKSAPGSSTDAVEPLPAHEPEDDVAGDPVEEDLLHDEEVRSEASSTPWSEYVADALEREEPGYDGSLKAEGSAAAAAAAPDIAAGSVDDADMGPARADTAHPRAEPRPTTVVGFKSLGDLRFNAKDCHIMADSAALHKSTSRWQCLDISVFCLGRKRELSSCENHMLRMLRVTNAHGITMIFVVFLRKDVYGVADAGFLAKTYKDLITKQQEATPKKLSDLLPERVDMRSLMEGKFIDVSQGVKRGAHSNKPGFVRTFTTSTVLYDFSRDVVLSGYEMLLLHGFPRDFVIPADIPEPEVRKDKTPKRGPPGDDDADEFDRNSERGMPVDDGCYNCGGTWSDTNPGKPWSAGKEKWFDKEPKWRPKFLKSARIRSGEIDPPQWDTASNVVDWETVEMEIHQELGLLSEAEFEALTKFAGSAVKAELQEVPSPLGHDKNFFIITLDGLPCTVTNGMRKLCCKYRFGLTREDMLLQAAKQLVEGQGKAVFSYHSEEQLKQRPKGLQTEQQFKELKSLEGLKEKAQKAVAKSGAQPVKATGDSSSEAGDDEDGDGPKAKKLKVQQSGRLQKLAKPKRKGGKKAPAGAEIAVVDNPEGVPKPLESVVAARGNTPKCFTNLHIDRILMGEKLMRSVDAARKIMDDMKAQRQFQWKTLHKHIELCEMANGLVHNSSQITARECRLTMEKLLSNNIELPFNIRVLGTEKILAGTWSELYHSPQSTSAQDITQIVDQMMSVLISWRHCMPEDAADEAEKKGKEVDIFSFDDLAAEVMADKEDTKDDEEETKTLQVLEEAGMLLSFKVLVS
ncbi:unnamed protein product [Symbiodinium sp. CCMP2592]|nr:unnamed protein product [Symbiodinium sp. CCMP2592]